MTWKDITLFQFQEIDRINNHPGYDEVSRAAFTTCVLFKLTEHELSELPARKAIRKIEKAGEVFSKPFRPEIFKSIGLYSLNYDMEKMTFGQYVELAHYFKSDVRNAHNVMATMSKRIWKKQEHQDRAKYFLTRPVTYIIGCVAEMKDRFNRFNMEYRSLFGLDTEVNGMDAQGHPFMRTFGWLFSVEQVQQLEGITREQAFGLPVRQAMNDLVYLKEKGKFEYWQFQQQKNKTWQIP